MTNQTLQTDLQDNGVLQITLDRPDKLNALNAQVLQDLNAVLDQAEQNAHIKALLLTGTGKAFCAGADIQELAELSGPQAYQFARYGQQIFARLENLGKPSLAAINGYAFGGGCELTLATSLRIAADTAKFAQPEVKLGIIPGYGGTQRLARLIGKGRAIDMCITARTLNATQALEWGLVTQVAGSKNLLAQAHEILQAVLNMGPLAVASTLAAINSGYDLPLAEALHLEATHFGLCAGTQDKQEGVNAFLQKRPAEFKGE